MTIDKSIDQPTPKVTIVGATMCQCCALNGHDGDSCRANLLSNGNIFCVICGGINAPMDQDVYAIVASIIRESGTQPFQVKAVTKSEDGRTHIALTRGGKDKPSEIAHISYDEADLRAAQNPLNAYGITCWTDMTIYGLAPEVVQKVGDVLSNLDFYYQPEEWQTRTPQDASTPKDKDMVRVRFVKGDNPRLGIRVDLGWRINKED